MKFLLKIFLIHCFLWNGYVFSENSIDNEQLIKSSILVLSQDGLFKKSAPGRALIEIFEDRRSKLRLEAAEIEQQFIAEEKSLTQKRALLNADDFQILAEEFDVKVEKMRNSRANKDRKLQQDFIAWRKKFVQIVLPIVREQMSRFDALVVLDTNNRGLIYDKKVNVTEVIIKRLDEEFMNNPMILEEVIK